MNYNEIISSKLKEIRESKGLSQRDLSARAGMSHSFVYYYENGRPVDIEQLNKICIGLGIDMFTFLDECRREKRKEDNK